MPTNSNHPKTTRERVESYRKTLRQAGLRPLQGKIMKPRTLQGLQTDT